MSQGWVPGCAIPAASSWSGSCSGTCCEPPHTSLAFLSRFFFSFLPCDSRAILLSFTCGRYEWQYSSTYSAGLLAVGITLCSS